MNNLSLHNILIFFSLTQTGGWRLVSVNKLRPEHGNLFNDKGHEGTRECCIHQKRTKIL